MGVVTRQATEVRAVILIERGTLPRAIKVNILDTVPPGIEATMAIPITMPGGRLVSTTNPRAISGTTMSCNNKPIVAALGCIATFLKSAIWRPAPIPSIASTSCTAATQYSYSMYQAIINVLSCWLRMPTFNFC